MESRSGDKRKENPFFNPDIIQLLTSPKINGNNNHLELLQNLRQLSTFHHQILNPKYFNQAGMKIEIARSEDGNINDITKYGRNMKAMERLEPETWDPIAYAPTIRKLFLRRNLGDLLSSHSSTLICGFNLLELIAQVSPFITKLDLDLWRINCFFVAEPDFFTNFLGQFVALKELVLRASMFWDTSDYDEFEKFLMKIDHEVSKEVEIVFVFASYSRLLLLHETILSPERRFITKNHKFSLQLCTRDLRRGEETRSLSQLLTKASNNLIPVKNLTVELRVTIIPGGAERNEMLSNLLIISQHVEKLVIQYTIPEMDNTLFFGTYNWPQLKKLNIRSPTVQLTELSSSCPVLEELSLRIIESKSIFINHELTDEENLKQIFGNCYKSLKILKFKQGWQYDEAGINEIPKIVAGSKLLQYLQELLPNTLVEAEGFVAVEDSE